MDHRDDLQGWRDELRSVGVWHELPAPFSVQERPHVVDLWLDLRDRLLAPDGLHRSDEMLDRDQVRTAIARCAAGLGLSFDELATFDRRFVQELVVVKDSVDERRRLYAHPDHLARRESGRDREPEPQPAADRVPEPAPRRRWGDLASTLERFEERLAQRQREGTTVRADARVHTHAAQPRSSEHVWVDVDRLRAERQPQRYSQPDRDRDRSR